MSALTPNDYLKLIISYLNDESKITESKMNDLTKECELDLVSEKLFENLYHNLMFYYKLYGKKNIKTEEQKYFFTEVANILEIIYASIPKAFIYNDHVKAALIYIINALKTPMAVNPEIVMKIFLGFGDIFSNITNKIIEKELLNFEIEAIQIINKLSETYYINFNIKLDLIEKNNLNDIISEMSIFQKNLPIYFLGFIKYNQEPKGKKYLEMKVYKYFNLINKYTEEKFIHLYKGYLLYGILSYKNEPTIYFNAFKNIQTYRINNEEAKNILILSIKYLTEKNFNNFLSELEKENFNFCPNTSRVLDIFDETDEYYKELHNQLKYYFSLYKQKIKLSCEIYKKNNSRVLWLNFIKLLLLNLSENDIYKNNIKITFYFIVNLFSPEICSSDLEFKEDVIPKLLYQNISSTEIISNAIFYQIIDKDYSKYYPIPCKLNNFEQKLINMMDNNLAITLKDLIFQLPSGPKKEFKNIQIFKDNLPFSLFQDYLSKNGIYFYKNSGIPDNLKSFYNMCFYDLEENEKEYFIENIRNIEYPTSIIIEDNIKKILNDNNFITLIEEIMKSPVMIDVYTCIFYYYSTNGEFDLEQKDFSEKTFEFKNNYINNKSIIDYYNEFCKLLNSLNYSKLFIIMNLPETIKAFTFRFLKIVVNIKGIKLKNEQAKNSNEEIDNNVTFLLLEAYLVFIAIKELNHFMKIYLNQNQTYDLCKTSHLKDFKEGGEHLIKLLFGHILIENTLNVEQAKYILETQNWNKKSATEFCSEFCKIKKDPNNNNCIVYLNSENKSMCDYTKLIG